MHHEVTLDQELTITTSITIPITLLGIKIVSLKVNNIYLCSR